MLGVAGVDTNGYNLAFKDPLIWGSDYWNFPTNQTWNPTWLGQIHRGTPWQTIYLKSPNVLTETQANGGAGGGFPIGINTWGAWTGITNALEAQRSGPVSDWRLAALLTALLDTNPPPIFSVNNPGPSAWAAQFDGVLALTNSLPEATLVLSSNSPAVAAVTSAIESARLGQPNGSFQNIGDVLAVPQLSAQSPFLDLSQPLTGISDEAYEAIPSQLLSRLGLASAGTITASNGQIVMQFSGVAGQGYALQSSIDLVHWISVGTNSPVNGQVIFNLPAPSASAAFFRTQLLP